ncbi:hypothetical protein GN956_G2657 [Arapaima gigas]
MPYEEEAQRARWMVCLLGASPDTAKWTARRWTYRSRVYQSQHAPGRMEPLVNQKPSPAIAVQRLGLWRLRPFGYGQ